MSVGKSGERCQVSVGERCWVSVGKCGKRCRVSVGGGGEVWSEMR